MDVQNRQYECRDMISKFRCPEDYENKRKAEREKIKAHIYHPEYQDWFASGMRRCTSHPFPYVWHIMEAIDCPKCSRIEACASK